MLEGVWRKGDPPVLLVAMQEWRTVWRYLRNLYIELSYDPAISLLGIYPDKTSLEKDTCTHMFTAALITIAQTWKQPKCPIDR